MKSFLQGDIRKLFFMLNKLRRYFEYFFNENFETFDRIKYISDNQTLRRTIFYMKCHDCSHVDIDLRFKKSTEPIHHRDKISSTQPYKQEWGLLMTRNCPKCKSEKTTVTGRRMIVTDLHWLYLNRYNSIKKALLMYRFFMIKSEIKCHISLIKILEHCNLISKFVVLNFLLSVIFIVKSEYLISVLPLSNVFISCFYIFLKRRDWLEQWKSRDYFIFSNGILKFGKNGSNYL